jgi:hypothetical protein
MGLKELGEQLVAERKLATQERAERRQVFLTKITKNVLEDHVWQELGIDFYLGDGTYYPHLDIMTWTTLYNERLLIVSSELNGIRLAFVNENHSIEVELQYPIHAADRVTNEHKIADALLDEGFWN